MSPNRWKHFRWLAIVTVFFTQPTFSLAVNSVEEDEYQIAVFTSLNRKYSSEVDLLSEDALNSDLLPSESNLQQERDKRDVVSSGDDVDECLDPKLNTCLQNCTNTEGGYNCSCFQGYEGEGNNCTDTELKQQQVSRLGHSDAAIEAQEDCRDVEGNEWAPEQVTSREKFK